MSTQSTAKKSFLFSWRVMDQNAPCERIFSKAGKIICKKRGRLSPSTAEKLIYFFNKIYKKV